MLPPLVQENESEMDSCYLHEYSLELCFLEMSEIHESHDEVFSYVLNYTLLFKSHQALTFYPYVIAFQG